MSQHRFLMLCYGARLSEPFVSYTQRKGTVITMKESQEKKSKLSELGATLQLGNKPLWKERSPLQSRRILLWLGWMFPNIRTEETQ